MPYKDPIKRREMIERRRSIGMKIINEARDNFCIKCKNKYPVVCMDFHHRNPKEKLFQVNTSAAATRKIELIKEEIKKCDLLCANCHRIEHYAS